MPPAFDSTKQAAAFLLLLAALLAAPFLPARPPASPRNSATFSEWSRWSKFPWLQHFLFEETNDIDIAFVGSSHIGYGIDTPYVQQKLDDQLGRKTVVRTFCWFDGGFDGLYFVTRDLLAHRHVKTLVFYDECSGLNNHHVRNLAWNCYASIIWQPRDLLEDLMPNLAGAAIGTDALDPLMSRARSGARETSLGCFSGHAAFIGNVESPEAFKPYSPKTDLTPADVCVFSPATCSEFRFSNQALPPGQIYFAKQFGLLAKSHGCRLVALHLPQFPDRTSPVITESRNWSELMHAEVRLMGIPEKRLFEGISEAETPLLYCDSGHLNANGQTYLTALITPALLKFYETQNAR